MPKRGPKPRTVANASRTHVGLVRHEATEAPSALTAEAEAEYQRLSGVLRDKGTLDRVDLAVVAECARIKALLDRAHDMVELDMDPAAMKMVGALTTQRRGLLRELGLTLHPSRSVVKTNAVAHEDDPISGMIKLA